MCERSIVSGTFTSLVEHSYLHWEHSHLQLNIHIFMVWSTFGCRSASHWVYRKLIRRRSCVTGLHNRSVINQSLSCNRSLWLRNHSNHLPNKWGGALLMALLSVKIMYTLKIIIHFPVSQWGVGAVLVVRSALLLNNVLLERYSVHCRENRAISCKSSSVSEHIWSLMNGLL